MAADITERCYEAALELRKNTSGAPSVHEIAAAMEKLALEFGGDVGLRLVDKLNDDSALAIRNAVDRASKGEP